MPALASTGLDVHPLCLGGNAFGGTTDEETSFAVLDRYADAGGNFVDTADVYPSWGTDDDGGESEAVIGRWLAARGAADRVLLATKVGRHSKAGLADIRPETIAHACDASLARLGVDRIGLYYLHRDDQETPLVECLGALDALVRVGKVAHVGLSNFGPARLREAIEVTARERFASISVVQPRYNLLDRAEFEGELQDLCVKHNIAVVPFWGLAMGFLAGRYYPDTVPAEAGTPRAMGVMEVYGSQERAWATLDVVREIAAARDMPVAAVALAWLRDRDGVVAPIAGARNVEQLEDLLKMVELQLTTEETAALDRVSA